MNEGLPDGALRPAQAVLFLGWGNPSRGDDALGPMLCDRLERLLARPDRTAAAARCEVQQDFQLQVEDAADLAGRALVVFIDASLAAPAPFACSVVAPAGDVSVTTHALSPAALLEVACKIFGAMPLAVQIAVRGDAFELGEGLSDAALLHLEAAWKALRGIAEADDPVAVARALATA